ncbi:ABC transporter ATP-binding protein [Pseudomonas entomophila]|uniref:ABC transporter ATP-binding protein n=1 Tax=Pseudomonas entomophila TaxID=312306 RepID=UPI0015E3502B|nr:ABC transporter ATP-binding protein [Pseudomonas entomophila]MBA1191288.1 ABC transporter ATP-binding protein [Pseudomonas entomophila]
MLKTFIALLGADARVLYRYLGLTLLYGLLSGLTIVTVVPVLSYLLSGAPGLAAAWLVVLLVGVALCWGLRRVVEKLGIRVGIAVLQGGRHRLGEHMAQLPIGWFDAANTARLSHVTTQGMMTLAQLPAHVFTPLLTAIVTPVTVGVALYGLDPRLGTFALLALLVLLALFAVTARLGQRADARHHAQTARASQRMVEFAQAQSVLRAFNGDAGGTRFLQRALDEQQRAGKDLIRVSAMSVVFNTGAVHAVFALLLVGAVLTLGQLGATHVPAATGVALVMALLLTTRFIDPLLEVASYSDVLRGARSQLAMVADLLAARPLPLPEHAQTPADASVELRGLSFAYGPGQPKVLDGVDLTFPAGSMTALVGASGSGKSTVMRLIARFFDADQGSVRIGGVDVRQMSSAQLAGQISQIFQDAYLFQGSIADNIRLGKPEASDDEVLEVARQAGMLEMLERLPQGLATAVGEGGARLSGGERQRLSIARALIKPAPILLVDEATAALDAHNQAVITETLARLRGQRTVIVIAHQLSTVALADRIVVLDQGRVCEQGTPAALREAGGQYAHFLAQRQTAKGWRIAGQHVDEACV